MAVIIRLKDRHQVLRNRASSDITKTLGVASLIGGLCWLPFIFFFPMIQNLYSIKDPDSLVEVMNFNWWAATLVLTNSAIMLLVYTPVEAR